MGKSQRGSLARCGACRRSTLHFRCCAHFLLSPVLSQRRAAKKQFRQTFARSTQQRQSACRCSLLRCQARHDRSLDVVEDCVPPFRGRRGTRCIDGQVIVPDESAERSRRLHQGLCPRETNERCREGRWFGRVRCHRPQWWAGSWLGE